MDLLLPNVPDRYKSASQIARIATESWTTENLPCPFCSGRLTACPNNTRSRDVDCTTCHEQFQLKSYSGTKKTRLIGAEYRTTIECIRAGDHPSMIIMRYDTDTRFVVDLQIIHRSNITASCVLPRKRLSADAKRAGWQGCIFDLSAIPKTVVVNVVSQGVVTCQSEVSLQWQSACKLGGLHPNLRGWAADVLRCVEQLSTEFSLSQVYHFAGKLQGLHPDNNNIEAKIRQQLQVLRKHELLEFLGQGRYRQISPKRYL